MRTFVIEGKPLEEVTIKVKGQSLTLTEGVEVTVIVVVASQQSVQADVCQCVRKDYFELTEPDGSKSCSGCGKRR